MKKRIGRVAFALLVGVLFTLVLEGAASVVAAWQDADRSVAEMAASASMVWDPELGWRLRPGTRTRNAFGPGIDLTTNARGFRRRGETGAAVPPGTFRILCLGDSFTLGHQVGDDETWPARMEAIPRGSRR